MSFRELHSGLRRCRQPRGSLVKAERAGLARRSLHDTWGYVPGFRSPASLWAFLPGVLAVMLVAPLARADPQTDYMLTCRGCHGPDGRGIADGAPSFRDSVGKFLWVPGGREYLVRVPGTAQSELSDARTAALLNWILREFSPNELPASFAPYTADEVARLRRVPLADVTVVRRALTAAIAARPAASTAH